VGRTLGRVDGFDQDEAADQGDEGAIVLGGLFAPQSDALEALDLAVGLLDARAAFVQDAWEEFRSCEIGSVGDHRADAAITCGLPIGCGIVALVRDGGARRDVGTKIEQRFEVAAIAGFATGQMEGQGQTVEIGLQMDLRREAATRDAEGLAFLPPFAPAAETCARTMVESNICTRWALPLRPARASKKASNTPDRLKRQKRFQTLFQFPNSAGSARQVML
jgi:hypothetical protein